jgi:beta-mannosidase
MAQRFFAPVNIVAIPARDGGMVNFIGINDTGEALTVVLSVDAVSMSGRSRRLMDREAKLPPDAALAIAGIALEGVAADEALFFRFSGGDSCGQDCFLPRRFKTYALPEPGLELRATGQGAYELHSSGAAFYVALETDHEGHFSDNAFHMAPGETRLLHFIPEQGLPPEMNAITLRHLQASS